MLSESNRTGRVRTSKSKFLQSPVQIFSRGGAPCAAMKSSGAIQSHLWVKSSFVRRSSRTVKGDWRGRVQRSSWLTHKKNGFVEKRGCWIWSNWAGGQKNRTWQNETLLIGIKLVSFTPSGHASQCFFLTTTSTMKSRQVISIVWSECFQRNFSFIFDTGYQLCVHLHRPRFHTEWLYKNYAKSVNLRHFWMAVCNWILLSVL